MALIDVCFIGEETMTATDRSAFFLELITDMAALQTMLRMKAGRQYDFSSATHARQRCQGSCKLMRQFATLALGVEVIKDFDEYSSHGTELHAPADIALGFLALILPS